MIRRLSMKTIYQAQKEYPQKLNKIYAPPSKLYVFGDEAILNKPSIAIIGCRQASEYGKRIAFKFAYELAQKGIIIISGLAKGIDTYAHLGAVKAQGKTIAVLGSGVAHIYPEENKNLCKEIIKTGGAIITEYEKEMKPLKMNFPIRNRIISGLSNGVLVVEAKQRSGTLITVDYALEQGKDVFVIPGNITNQNSYGTNELIKQGAIPVTNVKDILTCML
ncbi:MAG: DNA-processing protein DprA [Clostridia bacterium]